MNDLLPPSLVEMIAECERELTMRRQVYPRMVADGKRTQTFVDRRMAIMEAIRDNLKAQQNG